MKERVRLNEKEINEISDRILDMILGLNAWDQNLLLKVIWDKTATYRDKNRDEMQEELNDYMASFEDLMKLKPTVIGAAGKDGSI